MKNCIVIIPAYNPNEILIELVNELSTIPNINTIIVNDGSIINTSIFDNCEKSATILSHSTNLGKGAAIKTALLYILKSNQYESTVVIIDSDGQHKVKDMINVCSTSINNPNSIILGSRIFKGNIPIRSKIGNISTSYIFKKSTGIKINDTQTGLRAFSSNLISFLLTIPGNRYEYEMNVLLECAKNNINIIEVPIETIYLNSNKSSHFDPIKDSLLIYKDIIKFKKKK